MPLLRIASTIYLILHIAIDVHNFFLTQSDYIVTIITLLWASLTALPQASSTALSWQYTNPD